MGFVFNPTVKALSPSSLDYLARYSIKSSNLVTDNVLNMNYSIGVSAFRLQSFVSYWIEYSTYIRSIIVVSRFLKLPYNKMHLYKVIHMIMSESSVPCFLCIIIFCITDKLIPSHFSNF